METEAGLWGLLMSSFLASTLLPGGSEAALLYAQHQQIGPPLALWSLATLGNTLGGLTTWCIGLWMKYRFPGKGLDKEEQALMRIRRYGSPLLMLSWLPVVGDPLCLAAGWSGVSLFRATLFMAIGKGGRYALILLPFY